MFWVRKRVQKRGVPGGPKSGRPRGRKFSGFSPPGRRPKKGHFSTLFRGSKNGQNRPFLGGRKGVKNPPFWGFSAYPRGYPVNPKNGHFEPFRGIPHIGGGHDRLGPTYVDIDGQCPIDDIDMDRHHNTSSMTSTIIDDMSTMTSIIIDNTTHHRRSSTINDNTTHHRRSSTIIDNTSRHGECLNDQHVVDDHWGHHGRNERCRAKR